MERNSYAKFDSTSVTAEWETPVEKTAVEILKQSVEKHPDKFAWAYLGNDFTYKEIDRLSENFAAGLRNLGVKKGDRVLTFLPNCIQHIIAFYGIMKIGAVIVPCNIMFKEDEVAYQIRDAGVRVVVTLNLNYLVVKKAGDQVGGVIAYIGSNIMDYASKEVKVPDIYKNEPKDIPENVIPFIDLCKRQADGLEYPSVDFYKDVAMILYTSGTTSMPKGTMHTNSTFSAAAVELINLTQYRGDDFCLLSNYPMFQVGGWCVVTLPVAYVGGTSILMPIFSYDEAVLLIVKYKVNILFLAPTAFIGLLNCKTWQENKELFMNQFKHVVAAGAPVPAALKDEWEEKTNSYMYSIWGATEGMGFGSSIGEMQNCRSTIPGCIGKPTHFSEGKVVNEMGEIVPRGEQGELCVKSPGIALGYWNKEKETAEAFIDGFWHSGDAGYVDEKGMFYFVERLKDLIVTSAWKVAPAEVENYIYRHPAIQEVVVYGVPDEYRGQKVKAAVILKSDFEGKVTSDDIIQYCMEKMAKYKVPREIDMVTELPKTVSGKILRRVLREQDKEKGEHK